MTQNIVLGISPWSRVRSPSPQKQSRMFLPCCKNVWQAKASTISERISACWRSAITGNGLGWNPSNFSTRARSGYIVRFANHIIALTDWLSCVTAISQSGFFIAACVSVHNIRRWMGSHCHPAMLSGNITHPRLDGTAAATLVAHQATVACGCWAAIRARYCRMVGTLLIHKLAYVLAYRDCGIVLKPLICSTSWRPSWTANPHRPKGCSWLVLNRLASARTA